MHELGITLEMIQAIEDRLGELDAGDPPRVKRVTLAIGKLTAVLPDSIRFSFGLCSQGTAVEGAILEIQEIPARGLCRGCGQLVVTDQPYAVCSCGSAAIDWSSGQELTIKELEVE